MRNATGTNDDSIRRASTCRGQPTRGAPIMASLAMPGGCRCHSLLFDGLCPVIPTAIPIRHSRNLLAGIHAAHRLDARLKTAGMTVAGFPLSELAGKAALSVYVGYADGIRPAAGSIFPYPWEGSPGVIFEGCTGSCDYDAGAVRLVNNSRGSSGDVGCGS